MKIGILLSNPEQRTLVLSSGLKSIQPECEIVFLTFRNVGKYRKIPVGEDVEDILDAITQEKIEILIVDNPLVDDKTLTKIKPKVKILVVIDDRNKLRKYPAHLVVNPNIHAHLLEYKCDEGAELLLGTDFYQLDSNFDEYQEFKKMTSAQVRNVLIAFLGTDSRGATILAVKALKQLQAHFNVNIVISETFSKGEDLAREIGLDSRFIVIQNPNDIAKRMSNTDIVISSPDLFNEILFFKLPSVLVTVDHNQSQISEYAGRNTLAITLGEIEKIDPKVFCQTLLAIIADNNGRERMSIRMEDLVDGLGRFRLAEEIIRAYNERK